MELMPYEEFRETETIQYGTAATSASANRAPLFIKKELNELYNYVKLKFSENPLDWDSRETYKVGDVVIHNNVVYVATADNGNQEPPNIGWSVFDTSSLDMDLKYVTINDTTYLNVIDRSGYKTLRVGLDNTASIMTPKNGIMPWDNGVSSDLGSSSLRFNDVYAVNGRFNSTFTSALTATNATISSISSTTVTADNFIGVASSAKYADLAEKYTTDKDYSAGTVLGFGGYFEVTEYKEGMKLAGVVSTLPGYMLNTDLENGIYIALKGRVPCLIEGSAKKGQYIIASNNGKGVAVDDINFEQSKKLLGIAINDADEVVEIKV